MIALAPDDDARFRAVVAAVSGAVERGCGPEALADRTRPGTVALRPWRPAWTRFGGFVASAGLGDGAIVVADAAACFPSITPNVVQRRLEELGADQGAVADVRHALEGLLEVGIDGLPVGPPASAVLANAVLTHVDRCLRGLGVPFVRWVDDVVAVAPDVAAARRVRSTIERALADVGLEVNAAKTRTIVERDERSAFAIGVRGRVSEANGPGARGLPSERA